MENVAKDFAGIDIKRTHWSIRNFIDQEFSKRFDGLLAPSDGQLLSYILSKTEGETTSGEICSTFRISKATCSENLHRSEEKGLIEMKPFEEDKRIKKVALTKKGKEVAEQAHQLFFECQQKINACLDDEEKESLHACLEKIRNALKEE